MDQKDTYYPILTGILIFALTLFISCAHKDGVQEEGGESAGIEEEFDTGEFEEDEGDEDGDLSAELLEEDEEEFEEFEESDEDSEDLLADGEDEFEDDEELAEGDEEFEEDGEEFAESDEEDVPDDVKELEDELLALEEEEGVVEEELTGLGDETLEGDSSAGDEVAFLDGEGTQEGLEAESSVEQDLFAEPTQDITSIIDSPPVKPMVVSVTPQIPEQAVTKNGVPLNRFYFIRQGDSAESVSQLLYGNEARSGELKAWNPGRWKPGKVVYYSSPSSPEDPSMRSFFQERSVAAEPYTMKPGDWLSTVAKRQYGSIFSWKEIAVLNNIDDPDRVSKGTQLNLFPKELSEYSYRPTLARAEPEEDEGEEEEEFEEEEAEEEEVEEEEIENEQVAQAPSEAAQPPPQQASPPPQQAPPTQQQPPPQAAPATPTPPAQPEGMNVARLIQQNIFPVAMAGVFLLLLVSLLIVNKRKKARQQDDLSEDTMATRPKIRRK